MRIGLIVLITILLFSSLLPQEPEERQLWDTEFLKKRAPAKSTTAPPEKPAYRKAHPGTQKYRRRESYWRDGGDNNLETPKAESS